MPLSLSPKRTATIQQKRKRGKENADQKGNKITKEGRRNRVEKRERKGQGNRAKAGKEKDRKKKNNTKEEKQKRTDQSKDLNPESYNKFIETENSRLNSNFERIGTLLTSTSAVVLVPLGGLTPGGKRHVKEVPFMPSEMIKSANADILFCLHFNFS